jgi:hypothetical protein
MNAPSIPAMADLVEGGIGVVVNFAAQLDNCPSVGNHILRRLSKFDHHRSLVEW